MFVKAISIYKTGFGGRGPSLFPDLAPRFSTPRVLACNVCEQEIVVGQSQEPRHCVIMA